VLPALALLLATSCAPARAPSVGRVVPVDAGTDEFIVAWSVLSGDAVDGRQVLWTPAGAMIGPAGDEEGDPPLIPLRPGDAFPLRPEFSPWRSRLGDSVVSIDLSEERAQRWLYAATRRELEALRLVVVPDSLPELLRPALERLASANPHVALRLPRDSSGAWFLARFRPTVLVLVKADWPVAKLLAQQPQLEEVWLTDDDGDDPATMAAIQALPRLKRLLVDRWPAGASGRFIGPLEQLIVVNGAVDALARTEMPQLRLLRVSGLHWQNPTDLAGLKQLRWLGLPDDVTQAQLDAIVAAHPELETLEIRTDDTLDLSPLQSLHHLQALALAGEFTHLDALGSLRSLRYLALERNLWDRVPVEVAAVRVARPDAAVVVWRPMCLGSGWILLLVPLVALIAYAWPRRQAA
jgi:hypothetical protein